jgi:hypothetical protein
MRSTRLRDAAVIAAIAGSWPSIVAAALIKLSMLGGPPYRPVVAEGYGLSVVGSGAIAWLVWPAVHSSKGRWELYGVLFVVPISAAWIMLCTAATQPGAFTNVLLSPVLGLLLAGPLILLVGFAVGLDAAFVLRSLKRADGRAAFFVAMGANYGVAMALAIALKL